MSSSNHSSKSVTEAISGVNSGVEPVLDSVGQNKESQLTLELLRTIEQQDDVSQRYLAQKMGVALGLANSYLKRCVKKGWIKVSTAPANRYAYYLTPTGFSEKTRLTAEFFKTSFALFRQSGDEYTRLLNELIDSCDEENRTLLLVGLSDLTEIALMRALQQKISVVGVYQPGEQRDEFFGVPVFNSLPNMGSFDALLITSLEQTVDLLDECEKAYAGKPILLPPMLLSVKYRHSEAQ